MHLSQVAISELQPNCTDLFRLRRGVDGWEKDIDWRLLNHCRIAEMVLWACTAVCIIISDIHIIDLSVCHISVSRVYSLISVDIG